jgi:hypothetical protein
MTPVTRTRTVFVAADAPAGRASVGILLGVAGLVGAVCLAVALLVSLNASLSKSKPPARAAANVRAGPNV